VRCPKCRSTAIKERPHRHRHRCRPMLGFKSVPLARRYCRAHDELRNFLCSRSRMCQHVPAAARRSLTICAGQPSCSVSCSCLNGRLRGLKMSRRAGSKADVSRACTFAVEIGIFTTFRARLARHTFPVNAAQEPDGDRLLYWPHAQRIQNRHRS
jgi:hypothetical protein